MVEQDHTPGVSPVPPEKSRDRGGAASGPDTPVEEETAAIIAVLSLMTTEDSSEEITPQISAWARAGRREAVRPWTGKE